MLRVKFQDPMTLGSGEEDFLRFLAKQLFEKNGHIHVYSQATGTDKNNSYPKTISRLGNFVQDIFSLNDFVIAFPHSNA